MEQGVESSRVNKLRARPSRRVLYLRLPATYPYGHVNKAMSALITRAMAATHRNEFWAGW